MEWTKFVEDLAATLQIPLYRMEVQVGDDNKGRSKFEVVTHVVLSAANQFVTDWNESGYDKPRGYDHLTVESATGGSYTISPLNVYGVKITPMD